MNLQLWAWMGQHCEYPGMWNMHVLGAKRAGHTEKGAASAKKQGLAAAMLIQVGGPCDLYVALLPKT